MSQLSFTSIFGALIILSPDKREVLVVGQKNTLNEKVSMRFPGATLEGRLLGAVSPHLVALAERVVSLDACSASRAIHFRDECIQSVEETNWGSDVNTLILDEFEPHAKQFLCYVMTKAFDWDLVRKEVTPKSLDDPFTDLLVPKQVPLTDIANPLPEFTVPKAHQTVARKLLAVLEERVYTD